MDCEILINLLLVVIFQIKNYKNLPPNKFFHLFKYRCKNSNRNNSKSLKTITYI
jgi:hypothetical protein